METSDQICTPLPAEKEQTSFPIKKFREIVFQLLYSRGFENSDWELIIPIVMRQLIVPKTVVRAAKAKVETIWQMREAIDQIIQEKSLHYELHRIPRIELSVLRLGIFELLHSDVPPKVVISEAIRLTRKFATAEGVTFINAILDSVYKGENALVPNQPISQ